MNEKVGNELIQQRQLVAASKNDANGMEREIAKGQLRGVHTIQELLDVLSAGLVEQPFQPDIGIQQKHDSVDAPFPGFMLKVDGGILPGQITQSARPTLPQATASGGRRLYCRLRLQEQNDFDAVAGFEFRPAQDQASIGLNCGGFFDGYHDMRRFVRRRYLYSLSAALARRKSGCTGPRGWALACFWACLQAGMHA